ncbi:MAG TPA: T9SS type A sorting domain-containing protein, partial [Bacteroidia bacterium]|nr:T9SS type A sorting domain-containing protein [Bacteroidia bacterium]
NGAQEPGPLIISGNVLYGTTYFGGFDSAGTIFKFTDTVTGLNELPQTPNSVNLYPNPNNGQFVLQIESGKCKVDNEIKQVTIYNILGKKVLSEFSTLNSPLSINISNQPSGVYLYRVLTETGNLVSSGKFVIQ